MSSDAASDEPARLNPSWRRWFGSSALVAAAVVVVGRWGLEPLRGTPHYDARAMESFACVEHFGLHRQPVGAKVAFLGSSQTFWGLIPDVMARVSGFAASEMRVLGVEAGTPFDMLNLIRRNPEHFATLELAVIEVNPVMLHEARELDPRLQFSISQHGTWAERGLIKDKVARHRQQAEWLLPLVSVRRPLRSVFLSAVDPEPGNPMYPYPEVRGRPAADWFAGAEHTAKPRALVPPEIAARRMVGKKGWKVSRLQHACLQEVLAWMEQQKVPVLIHQFPWHPEVVELLHHDPDFHHCYDQYSAYVETLRPRTSGMVRILHPGECGVGPEGMADRMHLNELGAGYYSLHLGMNMKQVMDPVLAGRRRDSL